MKWIWRKIYIQVNQSSFSPNSAVVTRPDSGWVVPGSNPCSMDKVIIKWSETHDEIVKNMVAMAKNEAKQPKIGEKNTYFEGQNKVLQAGGYTGDVTNMLLQLQGCHGQTLALVPCAGTKVIFTVKFLYSSCKVHPNLELYRNYTGTLHWTLQDLYSVTSTV